MSVVINNAKNEIRELIKKSVDTAVRNGQLADAPLPDFTVEIPADRQHGDFAANAAMVSARAFHTAPRKIAEAIVENISGDSKYIEKCEIAGPGFINFFLNDSFYADIVADVLDKGEDYGRAGRNGERVLVEFVSANPTGPMHIGNARGGALGDCLAAVLDCAGYDVEREFYVNDAGNQIEKFGKSLEARYLQLYLGEDKIEFPEDGYHGADIIDRAKEFAAINGDRFVEADSAERQKALIDYALPKNIEGLRTDLARYRIKYDTWFFESTLHNDGELKETIDILTQKGLTYEKEGALWYSATRFGAEKDEVLIRANGNPTYFAADIAYHRNKFQLRGFDRCINIWGADHHGHVARLKGAMDAIGLDGSKLEILLMQLVHLIKNGETVRVSKRTGKAITLSDLLDDVPVDASRFFFNLREPGSQIDFDLDLAVEQSSQNPVYYVQYAYARICSIVKNLAAEGISPRACTREELELLNTSEERELIRFIGEYSEQILSAAKGNNPSAVTRYCIDLATLFHKFYNARRVKCDDEPLMQSRLSLCLATRQVIGNILHMFNIDTPEVM
ncbi:MAG: arginine--tRNA ligase [Clostridia bacterium]|nr:arginine--tRNA ligase [Clostridia bacterium]